MPPPYTPLDVTTAALVTGVAADDVVVLLSPTLGVRRLPATLGSNLRPVVEAATDVDLTDAKNSSVLVNTLPSASWTLPDSLSDGVSFRLMNNGTGDLILGRGTNDNLILDAVNAVSHPMPSGEVWDLHYLLLGGVKAWLVVKVTNISDPRDSWLFA